MKRYVYLKKLSLAFVLVLFTLTAHAQKFSISPSGTVKLCNGDTLTLEATSGFMSYYWNTGDKMRIIRVKKGGTYICKATDRSGNHYYDTVSVKVLYPIQPKLSIKPSNQTVCKGDSLTIEVTNTFSRYAWSTGAKTKTVKLFPKTSGHVVLETVDSNGCSARKVVQYTVKNCGTSPCDNILGAWPDALICNEKDSVIIEAKSGFKTYTWNDGSTKRLKVVKKPGKYTIKVTDANGKYCYDTIEVKKSLKKLTINHLPNPLEICKGDTATLKASEGFKSYSWNTRSTDRMIKVTPTQTTGYLVTTVDSLGCEHKEDVRVTVKICGDDCDNLLELGKKKALCSEKDSMLLEAKSGFKTYSWNDGSKDRIIKVKKKGWYVVTATTQWGKICTDSVYIGLGGKKLTVQTVPNPAVVCPGDKVVLEATSGFKSYWWNTGARYSRYVYTAWYTKTLVLEAVDSLGCEARKEVKIVVKDTCKKCPEIIQTGKKKTLCGRNDSLVLEAKNGYKNYKWNTGKTGRLLWVKSGGWYWLDFEDNAGNKCRDSIYIHKGSTKTLSITLYPSGPYCVGDSVLAVATLGFKSYAWNKAGSKFPATAFIVTKKEKLVVEATDSSGCEARAETQIVLDTCNSSVAELLRRSTRLIPNPAQQYVMVQSDQFISSIDILNLQGKIVHNQHINTNEARIGIGELSPGIYVVRIWSDETFMYTRLIKE